MLAFPVTELDYNFLVFHGGDIRGLLINNVTHFDPPFELRNLSTVHQINSSFSVSQPFSCRGAPVNKTVGNNHYLEAYISFLASNVKKNLGAL